MRATDSGVVAARGRDTACVALVTYV
jgi:hypothetical protein